MNALAIARASLSVRCCAERGERTDAANRNKRSKCLFIPYAFCATAYCLPCGLVFFYKYSFFYFGTIDFHHFIVIDFYCIIKAQLFLCRLSITAFCLLLSLQISADGQRPCCPRSAQDSPLPYIDSRCSWPRRCSLYIPPGLLKGKLRSADCLE